MWISCYLASIRVCYSETSIRQAVPPTPPPVVVLHARGTLGGQVEVEVILENLNGECRCPVLSSLSSY